MGALDDFRAQQPLTPPGGRVTTPSLTCKDSRRWASTGFLLDAERLERCRSHTSISCRSTLMYSFLFWGEV